MNAKELDIVIIGLTITSSWGNGHATTFRSLVKELDKRGHKVTFLEHFLHSLLHFLTIFYHQEIFAWCE